MIDVWKRNFTGEGVVVAVVDEGFDPEHPEIKANYIQVSHVHSNNLCDLLRKIVRKQYSRLLKSEKLP